MYMQGWRETRWEVRNETNRDVHTSTNTSDGSDEKDVREQR